MRTIGEALEAVACVEETRHWAVVDLHAGVVIEIFPFRSHACNRYHKLGGIAAGFTVLRTTRVVGASFGLVVQTLDDPRAASIGWEDA